jgi:hypothetical protein
MECLVKILLWSTLVIWTTNGQFLSKFSKKEVFFVNLEEGFFGCQVNETTEVLQIFKVEKLCDGKSDCYLGSDENQKELKCSNNCLYTTGHRCINGACLDSQCHCNDGWGGKGCSMPDDNECKYRPCDVFAHCTNNIGSYACTCFPGYEGDGHNCQGRNIDTKSWRMGF